MVGRGEVDEDLEGETKEECEKYGKVVKCVIFEVRKENCNWQSECINETVQSIKKNPTPFLSDCRGS